MCKGAFTNRSDTPFDNTALPAQSVNAIAHATLAMANARIIHRTSVIAEIKPCVKGLESSTSLRLEER